MKTLCITTYVRWIFFSLHRRENGRFSISSWCRLSEPATILVTFSSNLGLHWKKYTQKVVHAIAWMGIIMVACKETGEKNERISANRNLKREPQKLLNIYGWWRKSCTTWDVWNLVNNKANYPPQLVSRISQPSTVNSMIHSSYNKIVVECLHKALYHRNPAILSPPQTPHKKIQIIWYLKIRSFNIPKFPYQKWDKHIFPKKNLVESLKVGAPKHIPKSPPPKPRAQGTHLCQVCHEQRQIQACEALWKQEGL